MKINTSELLQRVELLETQLRHQSVPIVQAKKANPGAALMGIALLLALLTGPH